MNKPPLEPLPIAEQSNFRHELWLIYSQLRDAENDPVKRLTILERSRQELGMVLNEMNRPSTNFLNPTNHQPKSPRSQAANLNCRYRQKDLTPDIKAYALMNLSARKPTALATFVSMCSVRTRVMESATSTSKSFMSFNGITGAAPGSNLFMMRSSSLCLSTGLCAWHQSIPRTFAAAHFLPLTFGRPHRISIGMMNLPFFGPGLLRPAIQQLPEFYSDRLRLLTKVRCIVVHLVA